jgi:hypothetical protein
VDSDSRNTIDLNAKCHKEDELAELVEVCDAEKQFLVVRSPVILEFHFRVANA